MNTNATFFENHYYHVYNRTNNKETLFKRPGNQSYFLNKYQKYISPFVYTHAYSLLGNHYHFSIQVKSMKEIFEYISKLKPGERTVLMNSYLENFNDEILNLLIINQFQNFQISYVKSLNNQIQRIGSLFQKKFKRSLFDPEIKFKYLQYYIHHNARKHGLVKDFRDHEYQSYHQIMKGSGELINIEEILSQFGNLNEFEKFHNSIHLEERFKDIDIEYII